MSSVTQVIVFRSHSQAIRVSPSMAPATVFGRLSSAYAAKWDRLELLLITLDKSKWATITGFEPNGLISYLTGAKTITSSDSCSDGDHVCHGNIDPHMRITAAHGWDHTNIGIALKVWIRVGGIYVGVSGNDNDFSFSIGYWVSGATFKVGSSMSAGEPAALFVRLAQTAPVTHFPRNACENKGKLYGDILRYPFYTRAMAEQACLDSGCAGLASKADIAYTTSIVDGSCEVGWTSDWRGWHMKEAGISGCFVGYQDWAPPSGNGGGYCKDCPVCSELSTSYTDLQTAITLSPADPSTKACPDLGKIAGYAHDVVTTVRAVSPVV